MTTREEGERCPQDGCDGRLHYPKGENCSCHLSPPCASCVEAVLTCAKCGWSVDEEEDAPAQETPKVDHYPQNKTYPAEVFLVEVALGLTKAGLARFVYSWDWEVLAISRDGGVVAALAFDHIKWQREIYVNLGGVADEYRRQGLYRALWTRLVEIAQERNCATIASAYHIDNASSSAMHAALGRPTWGTMTRFEVPTKDPA